MIQAKLSLKFYLIACLLLGLVVFGWYGVLFLNANEILMEDNTPMDAGTKTIFTVLLSLVLTSWSISMFTVIRQILLGAAFTMDENGIYDTATVTVFLAFIFVTPVKQIPYEAVQSISHENNILTITIDKSKIKALSILKPLVRKKYHFFSGFTTEKDKTIEEALHEFMQKGDETV